MTSRNALTKTFIRKTARRVEVHLLRGQFAAAIDVIAGLADASRHGEFDDVLDQPLIGDKPVAGRLRDLMVMSPTAMHAEVLQIIRQSPLASFNVLSTRVLNKLERDFDVLTLEQLLQLRPSDIKGAHNFGPQQVGQIASFLKSIRLEAKGLKQ